MGASYKTAADRQKNGVRALVAAILLDAVQSFGGVCHKLQAVENMEGVEPALLRDYKELRRFFSGVDAWWCQDMLDYVDVQMTGPELQRRIEANPARYMTTRGRERRQHNEWPAVRDVPPLHGKDRLLQEARDGLLRRGVVQVLDRKR